MRKVLLLVLFWGFSIDAMQHESDSKMELSKIYFKKVFGRYLTEDQLATSLSCVHRIIFNIQMPPEYFTYFCECCACFKRDFIKAREAALLVPYNKLRLLFSLDEVKSSDQIDMDWVREVETAIKRELNDNNPPAAYYGLAETFLKE